MKTNQSEFDKVNLENRYYIDFQGLKKYRNMVDIILSKEYKKFLKQLSYDYTNQNQENDYIAFAKRRLLGMKQIFPDFLPNMTIEEVKKLSTKEVEEILYRVSKYKFWFYICYI